MIYAVVGVGDWGLNHVRIGAELREAGVVDRLLCCDTDPERAAAVAEQFDADAVTDPEHLPSLDVDAATIATPTASHAAVARPLLDAGVDLLIEKPLAPDAETAWDLVARAERADCTLAVGHVFRFHPALVDLRRRVRAGDLGDLKYLSTQRFAFRVPRETTGALFSLAVHDVDAYAYLLGRDPESICCRQDAIVRPDVDETASLTLGYGGTTGRIDVSWQVPVFGKTRQLAVVGTEGAAFVDYTETNRLELYDTRIVEDAESAGLRAVGGGPTVIRPPDAEPLRAEVEEFLAVARGESDDLRNPGTVGARAVELLELAGRSSDERRVVTEIPPAPGRWEANGHDPSRVDSVGADGDSTRTGRDRERRRFSGQAE
ncbi:Gfo/Idh/MocA family protein [Salinirubrum litoreum]|uniref:Gfo/Idh/MocA family protein n=1 Tax=Salinirubrum litoreum TaxID=1126234 RepID=A0ABD5REH0_9EURY